MCMCASKLLPLSPENVSPVDQPQKKDSRRMAESPLGEVDM